MRKITRSAEINASEIIKEITIAQLPLFFLNKNIKIIILGLLEV